MESKLFSFGKRPKGCSKVFKTFRQILETTSSQCQEGWFFEGTIISQIKPYLQQNSQQNEIRATFMVANTVLLEDSEEPMTMTVILDEKILKRQFCILERNMTYLFQNGKIIVQENRDNYVQMREYCHIIKTNSQQSLFYSETKDHVRSLQSADRDQTIPISKIKKSSRKSSQKTPLQSQRRKKNYLVFGTLRSNEKALRQQQLKERLEEKRSQSIGLDTFRGDSKVREVYVQAGSPKIRNPSLEVKRSQHQYTNFKAKVLSQYQVGKKTQNRGTGYLVEQIPTGTICQVVLWSEVAKSNILNRGSRYFFKQFKVNRKQNHPISFHSHFQRSSIQKIE